MRVSLLVACAVVGSGCAAPFAFKGPALPYEARVWLLDAEEELLTARARTEEARLELERAEQELAKANGRLAALGDGLSAEAVAVLKGEARAQVALAKATQVWRARSAEVAERAVGCADLRYAAARAEAEVRYGVEGANAKQVPSLVAKADACAEKLKQPKQYLSSLEEARDTARAALERTSVQAALKAPQLRPRPYLE